MVDGANQTFYSATKNAKFSVFKMCKMALGDKILDAPQCVQKIIMNQSKPILVIVSIKPFTRQSFRPKNCFTQNWVGSFYWDSLLSKQKRAKTWLQWAPTLMNKDQDKDIWKWDYHIKYKFRVLGELPLKISKTDFNLAFKFTGISHFTIMVEATVTVTLFWYKPSCFIM